MARNTRFQYDKRHGTDKRILLSVCIFVVLIALFYLGFSSLSESTHDRQRDSLEKALNRSIVQYYAAEGHYPDDLEELKAHYGLSYDEGAFFVDYRLQGANIFPDVTIIEEVKQDAL